MSAAGMGEGSLGGGSTGNGPGGAGGHIVTIDETNAQQLLIDESFQRPVLVDFWADWCEPCKVLMPLLEQLAAEYQGQFLLAKVNADEQQAITQQLGVQSLPTVLLLREGQPVDGFVGVQPEAQVRELLNGHLPKPWDGLLAQAVELLMAGEAGEALPLLRRAYEDSGQRPDIALDYAAALIETRRLDEAEQVLEAVRQADREEEWERLQAQLHIQREAAHSPEVEALRAQVAASPGDLDLRHQLAVQYSSQGMHRDALETLYGILVEDREHGGGATRQALLDTIATLGKGDPLAAEYQRKLFGLMY